jgi:hypothetical protein
MFYISAHQNDLKILKNNNLKQIYIYIYIYINFFTKIRLKYKNKRVLINNKVIDNNMIK